MKQDLKNLKELEEWYRMQRPFYSSLASKVANLIEDILKDNKVEFHSITSRSKEIESFIEKAKKEKYKNPKEEIQDFAGIRIITFVKSDVEKVCELIKPLFIIDEENSMDKGEELGDDKAGYRSIHYIGSFGEDRNELPEYSRFKNLYFEIQVRTILEHAWADISHDRTYKFNGSLPEINSIRRRFSLAAATLELVDREFDALANEIDQYSKVIVDDTMKGELNHYIDGTSLFAYLTSRFKEGIEMGIIEDTYHSGEVKLIEELNSMGIKTLKNLDDIIDELSSKGNINSILKYGTNFVGLLRDIMMIHDIERYFQDAWNESWDGVNPSDFEVFEEWGIDLGYYVSKYNLNY